MADEGTCEVCGSESEWIDDLTALRSGYGCRVCHRAKKALSQCGQDAGDVMDWVQTLVKHAISQVPVVVVASENEK